MNLYKIFTKQCLNIFLLIQKNQSIVNFILRSFSNNSSYFSSPSKMSTKTTKSLWKTQSNSFPPTFKILIFNFKNIDDIHTVDNLAHAHIAQCSAENIMLWCQFIQTFGLHETTAIVLAKEYHFKRVRNFIVFFLDMSGTSLFWSRSRWEKNFVPVPAKKKFWSRSWSRSRRDRDHFAHL